MARARRILAALVLVCVGLTVAPVAHSSTGVSDEQWPNPHAVDPGYHGFLIEETPIAGGAEPPVSVITGGDSTGDHICTSLDDSRCTSNKMFRSVLPVCASAVTTNCVQGLTAEIAGKTVTGVFDRQFLTTPPHAFTGSVASHIPNGASAGLWTLTGAEHSHGATYLVAVTMRGWLKDGEKWVMGAHIVPVDITQTDCDPRFNGTCVDKYEEKTNGNGRTTTGFAGVAADFGRFRCAAWGDNAKCALRRAFPAGIRLALTVRLSREPVGWLHGRINDPDITFAASGTDTVVTIAANPVKVPTLYSGGSWASTPAAFQAWFDAQCTAGNCGTRLRGSLESAEKNQRNAIVMPRVYEEKSFEAFETWKSRLNDAATVIPSVWSVRTLSNDEIAKASTCITGKTGVTGIVTTNATLYSQGPPTLNTTTNQLDYKVATAHYEPDGKTEFKGTYDLLIREDVADCLYGLSKTLAASGSAYSEEAPYVAEAKYAGPDSMTTEERDPEDVTLEEAIAEATDTDLGETDTEDVFDEDATIAAVDADVTTSTGATPVTRPNESISMENGWFKFSASNFTFSAPTVKVKVGVRPASTIWCASYLASLKKVTAVSPKCPAGLSKASVRHCVKGASVTAAIAVKPSCPSGFRTAKAITCAKGMSAKRIIAASPKCPAGFTAVRSVKCVKGNTARVVTAVRPTCANGFRAATTIACRRGTTRLTVTDVKPTCPKGFRRT